MSKALAIKYRPKKFEDLTEQSAVVRILTNQIETDTIKHGYLFCGGAGTGKTTSARIFADMINNGSGEPIELDAASNNSVDDVRRITEQAQTKSLDSNYKVFILDEVHSLSNQAWQAMLKTLEEPPAKAIFILCTTNPEKIPATILSRVQRYNFQRISYAGVISRLKYIVSQEKLENPNINVSDDSLDVIASTAQGGMRDAITLLDKCLSYSPEVTISVAMEALGISDYETMSALTEHIFKNDLESTIKSIEDVYHSGASLKQFVKDYFEYILNVSIYLITKDAIHNALPQNQIKWIEDTFTETNLKDVSELLDILLTLQNQVKWGQDTKALVEAQIILFIKNREKV